MRLKSYIIEKKIMPYEDAIDFIANEVDKSFINELKKAGDMLYRGYEKVIKDYEEIYSRDDRLPKGMNIKVFKELNKFFKEKFGWEVRGGVFTTGNIFEVETHGLEYLFFPLGKYKFCWSEKIEDLNYYFSDNNLVGDNIEYFDIVESYRDDNLSRAIKSGCEISFKCVSYVLVSLKYEADIKRTFRIGV